MGADQREVSLLRCGVHGGAQRLEKLVLVSERTVRPGVLGDPR